MTAGDPIRRRRQAGLVLLFVGSGLLWALPVVAGTIEGHIYAMRGMAHQSNFVVFVDDLEGPPPDAEQYAVMNQSELRFVPHVLVVQVGTPVEFPNSDPVSHNVFSISDTKRFNLGMYARGTVRRLTFNQPGVVELLCNVHMEMSAYIVVVKNPFYASVGSDGVYRLQGVPAGRHRLRCWHEGLGTKEQVVEVPDTGTVTVNFAVGR